MSKIEFSENQQKQKELIDDLVSDLKDSAKEDVVRASHEAAAVALENFADSIEGTSIDVESWVARKVAEEAMPRDHEPPRRKPSTPQRAGRAGRTAVVSIVVERVVEKVGREAIGVADRATGRLSDRYKTRYKSEPKSFGPQ